MRRVMWGLGQQGSWWWQRLMRFLLLLHDPVDRLPQKGVEPLGILQHHEVVYSGHQDHLDTVTLHGGDVGRRAVGIDGDQRQLELLQVPGDLAAVIE